jgi:hypothetical protein
MDILSNSHPDAIASSLGLAPLQKDRPLEEAETELVPLTNAEQIQDDFELARSNMVSILAKGNEALDGIIDVAQMSQHPRSYEVVATLIKTMADTNKDLLELSKKKKDLIKQDLAAAPKTLNQNLFVGSTSELQQFLKKQQEESNG